PDPRAHARSRALHAARAARQPIRDARTADQRGSADARRGVADRKTRRENRSRIARIRSYVIMDAGARLPATVATNVSPLRLAYGEQVRRHAEHRDAARTREPMTV